MIDNVTFERSAIEVFVGDPSTFDMAMGHSILHLLNDRELAISKVHELLKPGGFFVSSTICMAGEAYVMQALLPLGRWVGLLPMVKSFTVEELVGSLTDAGFEIDHRGPSHCGSCLSSRPSSLPGPKCCHSRRARSGSR